ncbi:hypothetical protein ACB098_07G146000 [Castanea mollissima]
MFTTQKCPNTTFFNRNNNKKPSLFAPSSLGVIILFPKFTKFLSFLVFKFWVAFVFNYCRRDKPRTIKTRVLIVPEVLVWLKGLRERGGGQFRRVDLPESFLVDVVPALWILYFLVLFFSILTNLSLLYVCTHKLN